MADRMRPVIIESPFAGCVPLNRSYLQAAIRDCLRRGETPYASHQMLTWALDDNKPDERELGISAGLAMRDELGFHDAMSAFYVDLGWSSGMERAREGVGMWDNRTIDDEREWFRIIDDAQDDRTFRNAWNDVFYASAFSGIHARDAALRARDLYLAQKARVA